MVMKFLKRCLLTLAILVLAYPLSYGPIWWRLNHGVDSHTHAILETFIAPLDWYADSDLPGGEAYRDFAEWISGL